MSESVAIEALAGQTRVTIDGRYRLEEQLGTGTLGVTYRARHIEHQRVVALKLLAEDVSGDALRRGRFEWEAATLAALGHPNIVTIVDYGVHEGRRWIAGEWLQGETLALRIARDGLPLTAAMSIVRQLLAALASAHGARLLHRNVKPSNVLLERRTAQGRERVKILDFAPVVRAVRGIPIAPELGSPYSPPEFFAGEALDARSDVFSVGATLIAMLSGSAAFEGSSESSVSDRARSLPGVDATLLAWIRRATAPQRQMRFADAAEMLRELIDLLPRDLRSPPDSGDGSGRAVTMPASQPPQASPPVPRPSGSPPPLPATVRRSVPPPLPSRPLAPAVSLPPTAASYARSSFPPPPVEEVLPPSAESTARALGLPGRAPRMQTAPARSPELAGAPASPPVPAEFQTVFRTPPPSERSDADDATTGPAAPLSPAPADRPYGVRETRGTLRPVEQHVIAAKSEPRVRQLVAAAVLGAFLIAVFVIFLRPFGEQPAASRAAPAAEAADPMERRASKQPRAAAVPVVQLPPQPEPRRESEPEAIKGQVAQSGTVAAGEPAGAVPPRARATEPPRPVAPSIVAAPGKPPVRDPWQAPMTPELERARELAINGAPGDETKIKMLRAYNRDHPSDARGFLVIGQFYCNRLWRTDCVEELTRAIERDPTSRGAPEILPALLDMVAQGKAPILAERLVIKAYGSEALDPIEAAFADVKNPAHAARLHALRLKISGGAALSQ